MKIGTIEMEKPLLLAPMAGVTSLPFRLLAKEHGASMAYTEMVSACGWLRQNQKSNYVAATTEAERPTAIQIVGSDPSIMAEAAAGLEPHCDLIDINVGCPAPKIVSNDSGAALLRDPKRLASIVRHVVDAVEKPVTVKIRSGWDEDTVNATEIAQTAEANGAVALTLHPRTRSQRFEGRSDWDLIRSVKSKLTIPVVGNGDIRTPEDVQRMFEETNCDGVMIGRAAMGNPWIFSRARVLLERKSVPPEPTEEERIQLMIRFARMLCDFKGEHVAMLEMRKHSGWFLTSLPHVKPLRKELHQLENYDQLETLMVGYIQNTLVPYREAAR